MKIETWFYYGDVSLSFLLPLYLILSSKCITKLGNKGTKSGNKGTKSGNKK